MMYKLLNGFLPNIMSEICMVNISPIAQLVSALDLVTSSVQVEGSILTAGKRLSLKNLNVNTQV